MGVVSGGGGVTGGSFEGLSGRERRVVDNRGLVGIVGTVVGGYVGSVGLVGGRVVRSVGLGLVQNR